MPLYDWECKVCGEIFEHMARSDIEVTSCHRCRGDAVKIISVSTGFFRPDAPWLETVREVVDKDGHDPVANRFLETPNRQNWQAWMKSRGIRPYEEGEKPIQRRPETDHRIVADRLLRRHQGRKAITLR